MELTTEDRAALQRIAAYEQATTRESDWPNGWAWDRVQVWPATLNRLIHLGLVEVLFHSNSYRGMRLSEPGREAAQAISGLSTENAMAEQGEPGPPDLPEDLFRVIEGYGDVKALVRDVLRAERPVHILFSGAPSSAKTLFLLELARLGAPYVLGSQCSRAGIADLLFDSRPSLLLVDEIDRIGPRDIAVLLSLAQTGIVAETKHGKRREVKLSTRVFAASNTLKMAPELLSRFMVLKFRPYSQEDFLTVSANLLTKREGVAPDLAAYISRRVWHTSRGSADPRQAVRVARLARDKDEVERLISVLLRYGG